MASRAQAKSLQRSDTLQAIVEDNGYFRARDCVWRKLGAKGDFWICELVREGHSFSDKPRKVALLPYLEDIEPLKGSLFARPEYREHPTRARPIETEALAIRATEDPLALSSLDERFKASANLLRSSSAVSFRPWQYLPLLRAMQSPFPRLLLADDVGLGKTTEAALILQHLVSIGRADRILIICPAHLCIKWQTELADRFGLFMEIFDRDTRRRLANQGVRNPFEVADRIIVSMDFAKRFENLKPLSRVEFDCVVVDECHHFISSRSGMASRLRELAETICLRSPGLLLLSATPFRGGDDEFESLLALVDPVNVERDDSGTLTEEAQKVRQRCIVRRIKSEVTQGDFPERRVRHIEARPTSATEQKAVHLLRSFLDSLLNDTNLEAPRLLAEVFQKRASSSWAALAETLTSHRAEKLHVPELSMHAKHADALLEALAILNKNPTEHAKLHKLTELVGTLLSEKKRVVIFTEYIDTLDTIFDVLRRAFPDTGIGCITGSEVWAAISGKTIKDGLLRQHLEQHFASENGALDILLCTDTCSEGIDLQKQCHHLIHFELPWSLVKLEQRNGRIDRFGQTQPPQIWNMVFHSEATRDQAILARLAERIETARRNLGSISALIDESEERGAQSLRESLLRGHDPSDLLDSAAQQHASEPFSALPKAPAPQLDLLLASETSDHPPEEQIWQLNLPVLRSVLNGSEHQLEPTATEGVFWLTLPPGWDVGQNAVADDYPRPGTPWRVCFDPAVARHHEEKRLRDLEAGLSPGDKLRFLSSSHPVNAAARRRYQLMLFKDGSLPVLVAPLGQGIQCALLAEASLLSQGDRSIVIWKGHVLIDEHGDTLAESTLANATEHARPLRRGDNKSAKLPSERQWHKMLTQAQVVATQRALDWTKSQQKILQHEKRLAMQVKNACSDAQRSRTTRFVTRHALAREQWLTELCEPNLRADTGEPAVRLQPYALILAGGQP